MTLNSENFGLPIPNAGPVFATPLVIHVLSGLTAIIAGAPAAIARKRPGRHPRAGRVVLQPEPAEAASRWQIFFVRNFTGAFLELGIGPAQVDVGRDEIRSFSNDLHHYVSHLHIAASGFIAATGLATASLAWFGVRRGELWAYLTAVAAPVVGLAVALPAHYPWGLATVATSGSST